MKLATIKLVLRELLITLGPALLALLVEAGRQVQSLREPDWRTLIVLALAQVVTIIARFSVPPTAPQQGVGAPYEPPPVTRVTVAPGAVRLVSPTPLGGATTHAPPPPAGGTTSGP